MSSVESDLRPFAEIKLRDHAFGLDVHPTRRLLAAGLITGQMKLFEWAEDGAAKQLCSARPHKEACRMVRFSADGASVFSTGGDRTLQQRDVETNKPIWRRRDVHQASINALTRLGDVGVATGDDDGFVTCWDLRAHAAALKFQENVDYVADILYTDQRNRNTLAVAGGDGHLSVFDLRAGRLWARSDSQEDELLCLALAKRGKKLLCGTQTGVVGIFSWGDFGDVSDRMLGHPASVDCMLAHGDDMVLTASSDGLIRAVSVHPNKILGVVGEHADEATIEAISLDQERACTCTTCTCTTCTCTQCLHLQAGAMLASCAHDQTIRLWDVAYLTEGAEDDEDEEANGRAGKGGQAARDDDDDDEDGNYGNDDEGGDDDDDDDDDNDDDDDDDGRPKKAARAAAGKAATSAAPDAPPERKRKQPRQIAQKGAAIRMSSDFFADM